MRIVRSFRGDTEWLYKKNIDVDPGRWTMDTLQFEEEHIKMGVWWKKR